MYTEKRGEWCFVTVPKEWQGKSIEHILREEWHMPKKLLHQFRMDKGVVYRGESTRWSTCVQENDLLQIRLFPQEPYGVIPEPLPLDVLYEDDHVLIVNKGSQIDTHPTHEKGTGTLANAVAFYLQTKGIETKVRHIHRLDRDTTGAVVFAKHALAGVIMDRFLTERKIKRTYWALVEGKVKKKKGTIDAPIGRDRHHPTRRRVSPKGDVARTHYEVMQYISSTHMTVVRVQLDTGRTHQIRVHMSYIGHPLVGDVLYGGQKAKHERQALHAIHIQLQHPITNENIEVEVPLPAELHM